MITKLSISNFKSIRQLDLDCKKVNLFIGEPNTGKSNILEALALLSWCGGPEQTSLSSYVRLESTQNLFYDQLLDEPVEIKMSTTTISPIGLRVTFERGAYGVHALDGSPIRGLAKTHTAPGLHCPRLICISSSSAFGRWTSTMTMNRAASNHRMGRISFQWSCRPDLFARP